MAQAVTCANCGATIRTDRRKCLRCGEPLRAVAAAIASGRGKSTWWTFGLVAGCVAAGGFALVYVSGDTTTARTPAAAAAAKSAPAAAAPSAQPMSRGEADFSPAPVALAFDAKHSGTAAYGAGDVEHALEAFRAAVDASPNDAEALNNLGQMLVRTNHASDAIQYFDRAVDLSQETWAYHFNRARAYAQLQQWPRAIAGYRDAARLFPEDYATQYNMARALQANGDLADAITAFERAIALAPGQADFHLSHGRALEAARRPKDAVDAYKRYLELEPASPEAEKVKAHIAELEGVES